jgi:PAS domain S-box-containing protein
MNLPTAAELRLSAESRLQSKAESAVALPVDDAQKMLHELQVHQVELEMQYEDLREAKSAEEQALYRYTELFDFAPIGYFALYPSSEITQVNLRGASLLGLERSNLIGRRFLIYVTHEHREMFCDFLAKAFETGDKQNCEILVQVGEHTLWLSLEANIGVTEMDCLVAMSDITERKQAEEKLKRAASVFTHSHEGIMITDATAAITEVNDTFSCITGYTPEEILGKNPRILQSGRQSPEFYTDMWDTIIAKGSWCGEIWNRRKNGDVYAGMLTISAVENAAGLVQHYVSLCTDIKPMK